MMAFVVHWLLFALSFMIVARIVPGIVVRSFGSALAFSAVFALLDGLLFSFLTFITLPLVLLSLGLFLLVIRAGLFLLADKFVDGVTIDGFFPALLGSVLTGVVNYLINWFVHI